MNTMTNGSTRFTRFMGRIRGTDKVIFKTFFLLLSIIFTFLILYEFIFWDDYYLSIILNLLNGLLVIFIITGIITYIYHKKEHIILPRTIALWFVVFAIITAFICTILISLLSNQPDYSDNFIGPYRINNLVSFSMVDIFVTFFLWIIAIELVMFFMSFGVTGILTAVNRGIGPETILFISRISSVLEDGPKTKNNSLTFRYQFLRWRFNVPRTINTKHILINRVKRKKVFPWKRFFSANLWALILGGTIGVNISLNGLLMNKLTLSEFFSVASFTGAFLLVFIFPFLVYQRMDARIRYKHSKGSIKLKDGLRNRTLQIFSNFAILSLLFRYFIYELEPMVIVISYLLFVLIFLIISIITIFVFYNYFEEELAYDIAERYLEIKD